jgi:hypothetical protein
VVRRVIVHDRTHLGAPPFARVHHAAVLPSPEDLSANSLSTADAIPRSHPISSGPRDSADPSCRPGRMPYRNTASSHAAPGQYLSDAKNPYGYCPDHGTGVACPVGIVRADKILLVSVCAREAAAAAATKSPVRREAPKRISAAASWHSAFWPAGRSWRTPSATSSAVRLDAGWPADNMAAAEIRCGSGSLHAWCRGMFAKLAATEQLSRGWLTVATKIKSGCSSWCPNQRPPAQYRIPDHADEAWLAAACIGGVRRVSPSTAKPPAETAGGSTAVRTARMPGTAMLAVLQSVVHDPERRQ